MRDGRCVGSSRAGTRNRTHRRRSQHIHLPPPSGALTDGGCTVTLVIRAVAQRGIAKELGHAVAQLTGPADDLYRVLAIVVAGFLQRGAKDHVLLVRELPSRRDQISGTVDLAQIAVVNEKLLGPGPIVGGHLNECFPRTHRHVAGDDPRATPVLGLPVVVPAPAWLILVDLERNSRTSSTAPRICRSNCSHGPRGSRLAHTTSPPPPSAETYFPLEVRKVTLGLRASSSRLNVSFPGCRAG